MHQEKEHRYINHILYAIPVKRGEWIEVIEDIPALYGIDVKIRMPQSEKEKNAKAAMKSYFNYLLDRNKRTLLTIELGLQTIHEKTLKLIKRVLKNTFLFFEVMLK